MKFRKNENGNVGVYVLLVVVVIVIGIAAYAVGNHKSKTSTTAMMSVPTTNTKAADLRSTLVAYSIEHMILTDQAVDAALDGNADASATATALYANGNNIGAVVGSVYGASAQTTFDSVWKLHLDQFVNYAVADKEGNAAAKTAALNAIQTGYTVPLATYLAKANPNLPEATLQKGLEMHVAMTAVMIDDHVAGNYTAEANQLTSADNDIAGLFSTLAQAIVAQYPAKF
jgi:hypothetical protein